MHAVDTNILVRLLVRDDVKQAESAERFIAKGAWVSQLVLAETMWVLDAVYDRTAAQIALALEKLLSHTELNLQDADVVEAALKHFKARPALDFSDCLVLEIARKAGHVPLGTFDKRFSHLDGVQRVS